MTPKEKAYELIDKMHNVDITDDYEFPAMQMRHVIKCALIAVDEIIETFIPKHNRTYLCEEIEYWQQVKQEIEAL